VKLTEFSILADENIQPAVITFLREQGLDVFSFPEQGQYGLSDAEILRFAVETDRIVLTHDSDFGGLVILNEQSFVGILYVRPGHIQANPRKNLLSGLTEKTSNCLSCKQYKNSAAGL
jgi:predicted nuclease of predicted toxin-antitoxin system